MDGGNFVEWGWCPPSYSPLEKMLLGWLTPIVLTEATTIIDAKPVSEGVPPIRLSIPTTSIYCWRTANGQDGTLVYQEKD